MTHNELCYLSATEAIRLFKEKKLSPVEVLQAQIKQAEEVGEQVNAFSYTFLMVTDMYPSPVSGGYMSARYG